MINRQILCTTAIACLAVAVVLCVQGTAQHRERRVILEDDPNREYVARMKHLHSHLVRGCYFTNWAKYRRGRAKYLPEYYLPGLCTHILFAFGWVKDDFTLKHYDESDVNSSWAVGQYYLVNRLKNYDPGLKTLLSVGGWTFGTRLFKLLSATNETRATFVESAVMFVRKHGFDGLDIDWEYPDEEDWDNYVYLMAELREAFENEAEETGHPRLLLTAAVSAGDDKIAKGYDIPRIAPSFDYVFLMSYDFHGGWDKVTGHNAPLMSREDEDEKWKLWNVDGAARIWAEGGMPREKIIIGIATYGRGWTLKEADPDAGMNSSTTGKAARTQYVGEAGVGAWYEFCEMLAKPTTKRHWHPQHQVPWFVDGDQWWGYDDEESIRNKMNWLRWHNYGGAFVWTLDFDDFNAECPGSDKKYPLIRVIAEELAGLRDLSATVPPYTTTTPVPPTHAPMPTIPPISLNTIAANVPDAACIHTLNGFAPHHDVWQDKDKCQKFILCYEGKVRGTLSCPDNYDFSSTLKVCVPREEAMCRGWNPPQPTTTKPPSSTRVPIIGAGDEFECPSDGFFADTSTCTDFFRCFGGKAHRFSCPGHLHFDAKLKVCVDPSISKCTESNVEFALRAIDPVPQNSHLFRIEPPA